jgi:hypothetical protein
LDIFFPRENPGWSQLSHERQRGDTDTTFLVSGVGAALALATTLKKHSIPGRIVLLGTPAEETDGGKIKLLKAHAYRDMDVCRRCY